MAGREAHERRWVRRRLCQVQCGNPDGLEGITIHKQDGKGRDGGSADRNAAGGFNAPLRVGTRFLVNDIEWTIEGGLGPIYRIAHKCSRWRLTPTEEGAKISSVTVRLHSHRKMEGE